MNKINRSVHLLKAAFAIMFREKKLLLFPIINSGLAVVVALFFIAPIALYPTEHPYSSAAHWTVIGDRITEAFSMPSNSSGPHHRITSGFSAGGLAGAGYGFFRHWQLTLLFAMTYFISMFLATFCNVAFYHEIMQALNGQAVSIRRGVQFAQMRWRAVMMWSLFAGLVGYIIQTIEQRVGFLGQIITGFIGFAWSVACIFIIPTLVRDTETVNPVQLLRHSAGTLKRTWGELVVGFVGFNVAMTIIAVPIFIFVFVISIVSTHFSLLTPLLIVPTIFLLALPMSWLKNVVNAVYRCALFIYATEGVIPEPFDKDLMDSAWKVK